MSLPGIKVVAVVDGKFMSVTFGRTLTNSTRHIEYIENKIVYPRSGYGPLAVFERSEAGYTAAQYLVAAGYGFRDFEIRYCDYEPSEHDALFAPIKIGGEKRMARMYKRGIASSQFVQFAKSVTLRSEYIDDVDEPPIMYPGF